MDEGIGEWENLYRPTRWGMEESVRHFYCSAWKKVFPKYYENSAFFNSFSRLAAAYSWGFYLLKRVASLLVKEFLFLTYIDKPDLLIYV